jgi:hypothetical protein
MRALHWSFAGAATERVGVRGVSTTRATVAVSAAGTHWSIRKMARAVGLNYTSVQRIWKAHELKRIW